MTSKDPTSRAPKPRDHRDRVHDRMLARWFWLGHVRPWTGLIVLSLVLMAIDGAMTGAVSALLKPMFDDVLVETRSGMVIWVALAIGGAFVMRAGTSLAYKTLMAYVAEKVATGLQSDLTRHLMRLDQAFFRTHPPGHLIDRVRGARKAWSSR